jgi:hypothetical protein
VRQLRLFRGLDLVTARDRLSVLDGDAVAELARPRGPAGRRRGSGRRNPRLAEHEAHVVAAFRPFVVLLGQHSGRAKFVVWCATARAVDLV